MHTIRLALFPLALLLGCPLSAQIAEDKVQLTDTSSQVLQSKEQNIYLQLEGFSKGDLLRAIEHKNPDIRARACSLLEKFSNELSKPEAEKIGLLLQHESDNLRLSAAKLLGKNRDFGEAILSGVMKAGKGGIALCAAIGLLQERAGADAALKQEALMLLLRNLDDHTDPRLTALNYLINNRHPEAMGYFKSRVFDPQPSEHRYDAATILAAWMTHSPASEAVPLFLEMMQSPQECVRGAALSKFLEIRDIRTHLDARILQAIRREGKNPDNRGETQWWILSNLRQLKDPEALPLFIEGLRAEEPQTVNEAIRGIMESESMEVVKALPDLVAVLRKGRETRAELSHVQINAAEAITALTKQPFKFSPYPFVCGNMTSDEAILIKARLAADAANNIAERERLLKWWDTQPPASNQSPRQ